MFKNLIEVLYNNITKTNFVVDEKGMTMRQMDQCRKIMFDIDIDGYSFNLYEFNMKERLNLGIEIAYLYKILSSVKKKDKMELFIESGKPDELGVRLFHKNGVRVTTSFMKIQNFQNIEINIQDDYNKPVVISGAEFQKTVKELRGDSCNAINITTTKSSVTFSVDGGLVLKRSVKFGASEPDDLVNFDKQFSTDILFKIIKVAGLHGTLQIYTNNLQPLKIKSRIGDFGIMSIYIKSKDFH